MTTRTRNLTEREDRLAYTQAVVPPLDDGLQTITLEEYRKRAETRS